MPPWCPPWWSWLVAHHAWVQAMSFTSTLHRSMPLLMFPKLCPHSPCTYHKPLWDYLLLNFGFICVLFLGLIMKGILGITCANLCHHSWWLLTPLDVIPLSRLFHLHEGFFFFESIFRFHFDDPSHHGRKKWLNKSTNNIGLGFSNSKPPLPWRTWVAIPCTRIFSPTSLLSIQKHAT
jgi:hypothetical protein